MPPNIVPRARRAVGTAAIAVAVALGGLAVPPAASAQDPTPSGTDLATDLFSSKVSVGVRAQLSDGKPTPVWVKLSEHADLSAAYGITDWAARGRYVYDALQQSAERSQQQVRAELDAAGVAYTPYYVSNLIYVEDAAPGLVAELAQRSDVARIAEVTVLAAPEKPEAATAAEAGEPEWGVSKIGAEKVWQDFGTRGEGIVVGDLDTGVQFDHPALANAYRGNAGGGAYDHDYNWYDPSGECGTAPCDTHGHGTHTMGTMVGDGGPGNQVGVAPGATWIAARGCNPSGCPENMLLGGGQWLLAPTDLSGANPRPELRPNVINNSWGGDNGGGVDLWYGDVINAWKAAGIFPLFAAGNKGPGCDTAGSPGDNPGVYSVAATTSADAMATFSSRGKDDNGMPDIAAPGQSIRSSVPGGKYALSSGTSMATPHVTGAVALLLSAAPSLIGNEQAIIDLLDNGAVDIDDTVCGGTVDDNDAAGEGRIDIHAAIAAAPRVALGSVNGHITDATTGTAIEGAKVTFSGPRTVSATVGADGAYAVRLPVGTYTVTIGFFGYVDATGSIEIVAEDTSTVEYPLTPLPREAISGRITDGDKDVLSGATVTLVGTPFAPVTTGEDGRYRFDSVPAGDYQVSVTATACSDPSTKDVSVADRDVRRDLRLSWATDAYGYGCRTGEADWIDGTEQLQLSANWSGTAQINLPFTFTLYGDHSTTAYATTSGALSFSHNDGQPSWNPIPATLSPNHALFPYWAATAFDDQSGIYTAVRGRGDRQRVVVEWRNVPITGTDKRISYEAIFDAQGGITFNYRGMAADEPLTLGESASIGIESLYADQGFQFSYDSASLHDGLSIDWVLPDHDWVEGVVTDANDGKPVVGATVDVTGDDYTGHAQTTDAEGRYRLELFEGRHTVEAKYPYYESDDEKVKVRGQGRVMREDLELETSAISVDQSALNVTVPSGGSTTAKVKLSNGSRDEKLTYDTVATGPLLAGGGLPGTSGTVVDTRGFNSAALTWGVASAGTVWAADASNKRFAEFTVDGVPTGRSWKPFGGYPSAYGTDLAYDSRRNLYCTMPTYRDMALHCVNPDTGERTKRILGNPWNLYPETGLAYRADDDSFYVGGNVAKTVYHVAGPASGSPGKVLGSCKPADPNISGLAWHPGSGLLWMTTLGDAGLIYGIDPNTCETVRTIPFPDEGWRGGGIEVDEFGRLLVTSPGSSRVFTVETGDAAHLGPSWLTLDDAAGSIRTRRDAELGLSIDTTGLAPGTYTTELVVRNNSGRSPVVRVPVTVTVT